MERSRLLSRGTLKKTSSNSNSSSSSRSGGVGLGGSLTVNCDFKKDPSVFRVTPSRDLRDDIDELMVNLEKQSPEGFRYERQKELIKKNNRLLSSSPTGGRRHGEEEVEASMKAHLGKRRKDVVKADLGGEDKANNDVKSRMPLLQRRRNEDSEGEGEESDEDFEHGRGEEV